MYRSVPAEKIFQTKPLWTKQSAHQLKSWTDTIEGYLNEAKKLTTLLFLNRKLAKEPYTWFITIYVDVEMKPKEITAWWKKAVRNLQRKGIVAIWVREPTRTNKVHYHLLLRGDHSKKDLIQIVEESLPSRKLGRWHKNINPIVGSDWRILHYITKAKTRGKTKSGANVSDLYVKKRLMFKPRLGIKKVGNIGQFWIKPKDEIWSDVVAKEKRIADGLEQPNVKKLAQYAFEFIQGYVPLREIERNFGYDWDSPAIQNWIKQVFGDENSASHNPFD